MYNNGVISGTRSEDRKGRLGMNLSLLRRVLSGDKNTEWKQNDEIASLTRFGIPGMVMGISADTSEDMRIASKSIDETGLPKSSGSIPEYLFSHLLNTGVTTVNNLSMLKGTQVMIDSLSKKHPENWLKQSFELVSSLPYPNWLAQVSKAGFGYIPDVKESSLSEEIKNRWARRIGDFQGMRVMRNMWGEPSKNQNSIVDAYIDLAGVENVQTSPETAFLRDVAKGMPTRKDELSVYPSIPERVIQVSGKPYKLSNDQYESMVWHIGNVRKQLVSRLMSDNRVSDIVASNVPIEQKSKQITRMLEKIYDVSRDRVIAKFKQDGQLPTMTTPTEEKQKSRLEAQ